MAQSDMSLKAHAQVRVNLAMAHLRGAQIHAENCASLEREHTWPATQEVLDRHFGLASASVISATCALEASINEFRQDAIDGSQAQLGAAERAMTQITELWDTVDRAPLLRKYQWVLSLARADALTSGSEPVRSTADLIALRDALVHYKPEWYHDLKQSKTLEARLKGKFALNRLATQDMAFVPYRACGYGSGIWAVRTVMTFLRSFYQRLGIEPKKLLQTQAFLNARKSVA
jgi:hypothetical protein